MQQNLDASMTTLRRPVVVQVLAHFPVATQYMAVGPNVTQNC